MEWLQHHFQHPLPAISRVYTDPGSRAEEFRFAFDNNNPINGEKFTTMFTLEELSLLFPGHYKTPSLSYLFATAHYIR